MAFSSEPASASILAALECALCLRLLDDPVTLLCGHTYCRSCLRRSMGAGGGGPGAAGAADGVGGGASGGPLRCGLCRSPCFLDVDHVGTSVVLASAIERLFPEEFRARAAEREAEREEDAASRLGLFFLPAAGQPARGGIVPGAPMSLLVYEPRYLLLMQRCLENGVPFGVTDGPDSTSGTSVRIESRHSLTEGRLLVVCRASHRFSLLRPPEEEAGSFGLYYGHATFVHDEPVRAQGRFKDRLAAAFAPPRAGSAAARGGGGGEDAGPAGRAPAAAGGAAAGAPTPPAPLPFPAPADALARRISSTALETLNNLDDSGAAENLRDVCAAAALRALSRLDGASLRAIHATHGQPPGTSGPAASPERWSWWLLASLAMRPADATEGEATQDCVHRLLICYAVLEESERFLKLQSGGGRAADVGPAAEDGEAEAEGEGEGEDGGPGDHDRGRGGGRGGGGGERGRGSDRIRGGGHAFASAVVGAANAGRGSEDRDRDGDGPSSSSSAQSPLDLDSDDMDPATGLSRLRFASESPEHIFRVLSARAGGPGGAALAALFRGRWLGPLAAWARGFARTQAAQSIAVLVVAVGMLFALQYDRRRRSQSGMMVESWPLH